MGHNLSQMMMSTIESTKQSAISQLPFNMKLDHPRQMNHGMFFKSYRVSSQNATVPRQFVLKMYQKPKFDVSNYLMMLDFYRLQLSRCQHCLPYMAHYESDDTIFVLRQYGHATLLNSAIDPKIAAFQMLSAVKELHKLGLVHGDIKLSNFLVSSQHEVTLTDFAPFKPGFLEEKDRVYLSYFFGVAKSPERIQPHVDEFKMCSQETDVYELALAILQLFSKQQLTKGQVQDLFSGTIKLSHQLECITHQHLRQLLTQMLDPSINRIKMQDVNLFDIFGDSLIYKIVNIKQQFNISPDNNVQVLQIAAKATLKQYPPTCYQCIQKVRCSEIYDQIFPSDFQCENKHEFSKETAPYRTHVIEDKEANDCLLLIIRHMVYLIQLNQFSLKRSSQICVETIGKIFAIINDEFQNLAIKIILPLLEQKPSALLLQLFTHVYNSISKLSDDLHFAPFASFCRFYLNVAQQSLVTSEIIRLMRLPSQQYFRLSAIAQTTTNIELPVLALARYFGGFTQALFQLDRTHQLLNYYSDTFWLTNDSIFSVIMEETREQDSTAVVVATLLERIKKLYPYLGEVSSRFLVLLNPKNQRVFSVFLRYGGYHQHIIRGWEQKLNQDIFLKDTENVYLSRQIIEAGLLKHQTLNNMFTKMTSQLFENYFEFGSVIEFRFSQVVMVTCLIKQLAQSGDNFVDIIALLSSQMFSKFHFKILKFLKTFTYQQSAKQFQITCELNPDCKQTYNQLKQLCSSHEKSVIDIEFVEDGELQFHLRFHPPICTLSMLKNQHRMIGWLLSLRTAFMLFFQGLSVIQKIDMITREQTIRYANAKEQASSPGVRSCYSMNVITDSENCTEARDVVLHKMRSGMKTTIKPMNLKWVLQKLQYPLEQREFPESMLGISNDLTTVLCEKVLNLHAQTFNSDPACEMNKTNFEAIRHTITHDKLFQHLMQNNVHSKEEIKFFVASKTDGRSQILTSNDFLILKDKFPAYLVELTSRGRSLLQNIQQSREESNMYFLYDQANLYNQIEAIRKSFRLGARFQKKQDAQKHIIDTKLSTCDLRCSVNAHVICAHRFGKYCLVLDSLSKICIYLVHSPSGDEICQMLGSVIHITNCKISGQDSINIQFKNVAQGRSDVLDRVQQQVEIIQWQPKFSDEIFEKLILDGIQSKPIFHLQLNQHVQDVKIYNQGEDVNLFMCCDDGVLICNLNMPQITRNAADSYTQQPSMADKYSFKFTDQTINNMQYNVLISSQVQQAETKKQILINKHRIMAQRLQLTNILGDNLQHLYLNVTALMFDLPQATFLSAKVNLQDYIKQEHMLISRLNYNMDQTVNACSTIKIIGSFASKDVRCCYHFKNVFVSISKRAIFVHTVDGVEIWTKEYDMYITDSSLYGEFLIIVLQEQYVLSINLNTNFKQHVMYEMTQDVKKVQCFQSQNLINYFIKTAGADVLAQVAQLPTPEQTIVAVYLQDQMIFVAQESIILSINFVGQKIAPTSAYFNETFGYIGFENGTLLRVDFGIDVTASFLPQKAQSYNPIKVSRQQQMPLDTSTYPGAGMDGYGVVSGEIQNLKVQLIGAAGSGVYRSGVPMALELGIVEAQHHVQAIISISLSDGILTTIDRSGRMIQWL